MGRVKEYAYLNAKLRARLGLMKSSGYISQMLKAPTLAEAISFLSRTKHSSLVKVYNQTGDLEMVELSLFSSEVEDYKDIASYLNGKRKAFVNALLEKLEIENLKSACRMFYSATIHHHSLRNRASYLYRGKIVSEIDWDGIINADSWKKVQDAVQLSPISIVFEETKWEEIVSKGLFDFEIRLDQFYYKNLFKTLSKLPCADRKVASSIYNIDIDLKNILLLIRFGYFHHLSLKDLEHVILPYGNIYKEVKERDLFRNENIIKELNLVIKRLYPAIYNDVKNVRNEGENESRREENARKILSVEHYLAKTRIKEYEHLLVENPFTIGITLSYLFLSLHEDSLIRAILSAKMYHWNEERIKEAIS